MFSFSPAIPARGDLDWCWYLRRQGKSGEVLERLLHDIGVMDPSGWAPWAGSRLTQTGAPVEILFSSGQSDLQIVTEVADPATDPARRMGRVCNVIKQVGGVVPGTALRDVIGAAQSDGKLRFGARLGLTHGAAGLQCRLIAELPGITNDLSPLLCSDRQAEALSQLTPNARATQVEVDAATGRAITTYEMPAPTTETLTALARATQHSPDMMHAAVAGLTGTDEDLALERLWFSVSDGQDSEAPFDMTLSFSASDLGPTDAIIARQIKSISDGAMPAYAQFVDSLQPAPVNFTHHGKVGLTARPGAVPVLSVSVAAPWLCPFEAEIGGF